MCINWRVPLQQFQIGRKVALRTAAPNITLLLLQSMVAAENVKTKCSATLCVLLCCVNKSSRPKSIRELGSNKVHQLHVRTCSSSPRMLTSMATQMRSRQSVRPAGSENMVSHNRTASGKENSCAFRLALSCNARIGECLPAVQLL